MFLKEKICVFTSNSTWTLLITFSETYPASRTKALSSNIWLFLVYMMSGRWMVDTHRGHAVPSRQTLHWSFLCVLNKELYWHSFANTRMCSSFIGWTSWLSETNCMCVLWDDAATLLPTQLSKAHSNYIPVTKVYKVWKVHVMWHAHYKGRCMCIFNELQAAGLFLVLDGTSTRINPSTSGWKLALFPVLHHYCHLQYE